MEKYVEKREGEGGEEGEKKVYKLAEKKLETFICENCDMEGEFQMKCSNDLCEQKVCKNCCPFLERSFWYRDDALLGECLACYKHRRDMRLYLDEMEEWEDSESCDSLI